MKQSFEEFIELIDKSTEGDPWVRDRKLEGYCQSVANEVQELLQAIEKKDYENAKEELGDVLMDWAHACKLAEERGLFTLKDVLEGINAKIKRRKPYILDDQKRTVTKEEAVEIWKKVKVLEKEEKAKRMNPQNSL